MGTLRRISPRHDLEGSTFCRFRPSARYWPKRTGEVNTRTGKSSGAYNTVVNEEVSLICVQVVIAPHNPETIRTPTTSNSTPETNWIVV